MKTQLDNHIRESIRYRESNDKLTHKLGNRVDIHEKQIYFAEEKLKMLMQTRELHQLELANIKNQQDHAATAMEKLSSSLDNLTQQIGKLFTIKNMVIGGFASVIFLCSITLAAVKLYLDYKG